MEIVGAGVAASPTDQCEAGQEPGPDDARRTRACSGVFLLHASSLTMHPQAGIRDEYGFRGSRSRRCGECPRLRPSATDPSVEGSVGGDARQDVEAEVAAERSEAHRDGLRAGVDLDPLAGKAARPEHVVGRAVDHLPVDGVVG
jgi:hypothetical protein